MDGTDSNRKRGEIERGAAAQRNRRDAQQHNAFGKIEFTPITMTNTNIISNENLGYELLCKFQTEARKYNVTAK